MKKSKNLENVKRYNKTKKGLLSVIFNSQKHNSKKRNMELPKYTKEELKEWLFSQKNFEELYNNWENNDYISIYKPSIDRLNNYKPYSLDNIQLVTWEYNRKKSHEDVKNGINNKQATKIIQLSKDYEVIKVFNSINIASRELLKSTHKNISKVLDKYDRTAYGFVWLKYENYEEKIKIYKTIKNKTKDIK